MEQIVYPYKVKFFKMLLISVFMIGLAAFMVYTALTNEQGLIINRVIHLGPMGATIFFWTIESIIAFGAIVCALALIKGFNKTLQVVLTETEISAPKSSLNSKVVTIPYNEIVDLNTQNVNGQMFLNIHHVNGKLTISHSMLPNKATLQELAQVLYGRLEHLQS